MKQPTIDDYEDALSFLYCNACQNRYLHDDSTEECSKAHDLLEGLIKELKAKKEEKWIIELKQY